jgi:prolipoprotein diacylglyceryltransferase
MSAAITVAFDPSLHLGGAQLRWDTLALAAVLQVALVLWVLGLNARLRGSLSLEALSFVLLATVTGAVIGGRVVHVLDFFDVYAADPVAAVDLGRGSLSLVGAVIGGLVTGGYVCRIAGGRVGAWADAAAIPLLVAIGGGKVALALGGGGQGAPWTGSWALAFAGDGPWRAIDAAVPAWPAQVLEGLWTLAGIPVVMLTRRMASRRYEDRGSLLLLAIAWWLVGRVVVALTWRDVPILGPLGAEAVATLVALLLVVAAAVVIVTFAWRAAPDQAPRSGVLSPRPGA